jgi:hypothetical protein
VETSLVRFPARRANQLFCIFESGSRSFAKTRTIENIFRTLNPATIELAAREGYSVEFKEVFNWGSTDKYAKTMTGQLRAKSVNQQNKRKFGVKKGQRAYDEA